MSIDWNQLADQYSKLAATPAVAGDQLHAYNLAMRDLIGRAASALPKDNPASLSWFTAALQQHSQKWFVAKVMSVATPVPRTLFDPLLLAALLEPDPSANRVFVEPCIRTFGAAEVASRTTALASHPGVAEHGGVEKVMYWVPRTGA